MSCSRFFASGLLLLPLALSGCNTDPCLDDGFVNGTCDKPNDKAPADPNPGGPSKWCKDTDADGFGDPASCQTTKPTGAGFVTNGDDCDDADPTAYPGAAENEPNANACMRDTDLDGYGDQFPAGQITVVTPGTDCNDNDPKSFPGAAEKEDPKACMRDADEDGYGDANPVEPGIEGGDKVTPGTDCDDAQGNTFPGAAPNDDAKTCMKDADGDDYGDNSPPAGKDAPVAAGSDCDDDNAETHTGAAEKELTDKCTKDADNDGFADNDPPADEGDITPGTDCDDLEAQTFPGASENETGDVKAACTKDTDKDGFADNEPSQDDITPGLDCDDGNDHIHPGAAENELPGECTKDVDDDGFGDFDNHGDEDVVPGSDCDDNDPDSNVDCDKFDPLKLEVPANYNIKKGEEVVLEAKATGGSKNYRWTWTPDDSLSAKDEAQPTAKPSATTSYTVTVSDVNKTKTPPKSAKVTVHVTDAAVDLGRCLDTGLLAIGGFEIEVEDNAKNLLIQDPKWTWEDPELCQLENSQPSAVICKDWVLDNGTVQGELFANPDPSKNDGTPDDDWIGVAWGVQDSMKQYYLLSWKGRIQDKHDGCGENGNFLDGIYIRRFDETKGNPLGCYPLVGTNNDQEATYTVLAKPEHFQVIKGSRNIALDGWKKGMNYHYELVHAGERSIFRIYNDDKSEGVEVEFVDNAPLLSGHWGAFTMSQDSSCYQNVFTKSN